MVIEAPKCGPSNSGTDTAAQVFVPPLNRYWMLTTLADSKFHLMEVDPTTSPWTMRRTSHAGLSPALPADSSHVLCQRIQWMPGLNAIIVHRRGDENVLMFRF